MAESKWLFYFGLIVIQLCYCFKFGEQVYSVLLHFRTMTDSEYLFTVLNLIDMLLIASLIRMVAGTYQPIEDNKHSSYLNFVDTGHTTETEKPHDDHDTKVSNGGLKIKMGTTLVGISGINLLQTFFNPATINNREILFKCMIHLIFLVSAFVLAAIEYLYIKGKTLEEK